MPDLDGVAEDIVLGYDSADGYRDNGPYLGVVSSNLALLKVLNLSIFKKKDNLIKLIGEVLSQMCMCVFRSWAALPTASRALPSRCTTTLTNSLPTTAPTPSTAAWMATTRGCGKPRP